MRKFESFIFLLYICSTKEQNKMDGFVNSMEE